MRNTARNRPWLVAVSVFAAYLTAFKGTFQFDDYNVIVDNESVHSFAAWASGAAQGIRPLLKLSYTLNWVSGWGLFGFHLFNVSIHAANSLLVYVLGRRLLGRLSVPDESREPAAFGAALLFALHPLQTEAVTYICGRSVSLMALFYFGSMLAYVHGVERGKRFFYWFLSPLLFLGALAVRETALTLPFALLLWELMPGQREGRRLFRNLAMHAAILGILAFVLLVHPGYRDLLGDSLATRGAGLNLLNQVTALAYLLSRFVFINRLNADPDLPLSTAGNPLLLSGAFVLIMLVIAGLVLLRKRPWLGFGMLWFFLHLVPTNSFVPRLDLANERHLYIAGWGLFMAVSAEVCLIGARNEFRFRAITSAVSLVLLVLGASTAMRNQVYWSEASFWEDAVTKGPDNARAHNNLGYAYFESGRRQDAAAEYREAIRLRPGYDRAEKNLRSLLVFESKQAPSGKDVR